jgi:hypothetical protein
LPVLRAASRVGGRVSENRCPGRAILPPMPQFTQINAVIEKCAK